MFFYLSFLRPPPLQAGPYGTISITPQISNDLRTEHFDSTHDLYYSWIREGAVAFATKAVKLTTWRLATAYKEIPLPVPPGVREGQSWRLVLMGEQQAIGQVHPESIDLSSTKVGRVPFPVTSMPVLFVGKGSKSSPKQEMIRRNYLVPYLDTVEGGEVVRKIASLKFSEKTSFDLDKKIWDSGIGLSSWMIDLQGNSALVDANPILKDLHVSLFSDQPRKILELGAGIGMLSVVLAVMRSAPEDHGDRILATDVESAMSLLEQNISENSQYYTSTTPDALVLDWDDDLSEEVKNLVELDVIVMADVTYNTTSFPALIRTLSRLSKIGSRSPAILLGYKERDKGERSFWDLAADAGITFQIIGERAGAGGAPVEVWLGYFNV